MPSISRYCCRQPGRAASHACRLVIPSRNLPSSRTASSRRKFRTMVSPSGGAGEAVANEVRKQPKQPSATPLKALFKSLILSRQGMIYKKNDSGNRRQGGGG